MKFIRNGVAAAILCAAAHNAVAHPDSTCVSPLIEFAEMVKVYNAEIAKLTRGVDRNAMTEMEYALRFSQATLLYSELIRILTTRNLPDVVECIMSE